MINQLLAVGAPIPIGNFIQGGYFAGYYSMNGNNVATHGLIVAPKSGGETTGIFGSFYSDSDSQSFFDGATNTANADSLGGSPAFSFCANLSLNGYSDWYLPSVLELQLAYLNFKPTTTQNDSNAYDTSSYAVPQFFNAWSSTFPAQTTIPTFQNTGSNFFSTSSSSPYYWSSTVSGTTSAYGFDFNNGRRPNLAKNYSQRIRAFRKVPLGTLYS